MHKAQDARGREVLRPADSGIHGLRSFAVDYSGASGAPGLFAVADRITGGHRKVCVFQLPPGGRSGRSEASLSIAGNAFTLTQGDASLKATFVTPAGVRVFKSEGTQKAHPLSQ